jgi:Cu(I)/Ag(I) efflux system membrane protein CusA/SilA
MIERLIEWSARRPLTVLAVVLGFVAWAVVCVRQMPLDALPDLSDPQVIVYTEWMGRSPDLVEDQITYPLVRALRSTPGGVQVVRGYSMFGMSFVYVVFNDGADLYWARSRVNELLPRVRLPPGVVPQLGPDATGIGWVYEYVLEDTSGELDLAELRTLQEFTIRQALQAVDGVSEVATVGGFERQYQVIVDPDRLAAYGLSVGELSRAVGDSNSEVGARVLEMAGREYVLRGRGYVHSLEDVESSVVALGAGGNPIRVRDVARVAFGPEIRRGAVDWNGRGEAVGGIVVMRAGSNALDVIERVEARIAELELPEGVRLVPAYDRSELIEGSIDTLTETILEEFIIVGLTCLFFLLHFRSAFVVVAVIPLAVLVAFIPMYYLGMTANLMSLGGMAIAIGELEDASTTFVENAARRLAALKPGEDRWRAIVDSAKEVGRPTFSSLLLQTVSFLPILTLTGQAGRLFRPLALTFAIATFAASILSVTVCPPLMTAILRGRFRSDDENPFNRLFKRLYQPLARLVVRARWIVVALALGILGATVPVAWNLGSEFMPPLDEGSLLVMPATFSGISIQSARDALAHQDAIITSFDEVSTVFGKAGRAQTATDPAQLEMIETVVMLRPRSEWPLEVHERWWQGAPLALTPALRWLWPDRRPRTIEELAADISAAIDMPGYQTAVAPPIRTRIDMLTTGVRTPVGIKVFGTDLAEIERLSVELEGMLRTVPGTRSTFAERQSGREYVDVTPDREAIARYGLTVRDVNDVVEAAIGGMSVSTIIDGRARYSMIVRFGSDYRADVSALRSILVPVRTGGAIADVQSTGTGSGAGVETASGAMGASMGSARAAPEPTMASAPGVDPATRFRMPAPAVPLGQLADIRIVTGPPMIRDEDGVLVGYVYADVDLSQRDLGGWVTEAKALVDERLDVPPGYRLAWTGQYEHMEVMQQRMAWVVPLSLLGVLALIRFAMRGWAQAWLVLLSLPFGLVGSVWLLHLSHYNVSTAVWVGLIAVFGIAQETGILLVEFLDASVLDRVRERGRALSAADIDDAIVQGASRRLRPLAMSVFSTALGLLPLMWESGPGADVSARIAAPVIGGVFSCLVLTLLVLPAAYAIWRRWQLRRGTIFAEASDGEPEEPAPA